MAVIAILPTQHSWMTCRQLEKAGRDIHRVGDRYCIARPHDPERIARECRAVLRRVSGYQDVPPSAA